MKLSAQAARDLKPGAVLKDDKIKGLELHANEAGKVWKLYYRFAREQRRPVIASYPAHSIENARELAQDWHQQLARGIDPQANRTAYATAPRVSDLCHEYVERWASKRDKPRTLEEKKRIIKLHVLPQLGHLRVVDAKLSDIDARLESVASKSGTGAARGVRAALSSMFRFAEHDDLKWRERYTNPVRDAKRYRPGKRRRHMEGHEAPAVARELDRLAAQYPERVAALWIILFAGTRVTELITAKRAQMRGNTIVLTEHKTQRTGDDRTIVLPAQALAYIAKLKDDGSGFIFGRDVTRYHIFTVWDLARKAAGCPDLRVQDFRRTFASAAKSAGRSIETVGELFGHKERQTTDGYMWLFEEAATEAAQDTANELEKRMRGQGNEQSNGKGA